MIHAFSLKETNVTWMVYFDHWVAAHVTVLPPVGPG